MIFLRINRIGLRSKLKKVYAPFGILLGKLGFSPNMISILSLIVGLCASFFYFKSQALIAVVMLSLSGLLDLSDGVVSIIYNKATKFGSVLDWIADKFVDTFVLGAIGLAYSTPLIALLAIEGSVLNSFIKPTTYAEIGFKKREKGKIIDELENTGIFGRAETFLILIIFSVLHLFSIKFLNLETAIIIVALFTNISLLQRLFYLYIKFGKIKDV